MGNLRARILAMYDESEIAPPMIIPNWASAAAVHFTADLIRSIQDSILFIDDFKEDGVYKLKPSIAVHLSKINFQSSDYWDDDGKPLKVREMTGDEYGVIEAVAPQWYKETMAQPEAVAKDLFFRKLGILAKLYETETRRAVYRGKDANGECQFQFHATVGGRVQCFGITLNEHSVMHIRKPR